MGESPAPVASAGPESTGDFFCAGRSSSNGPSSWLSITQRPSRQANTLVTTTVFSVAEGSRYQDTLEMAVAVIPSAAMVASSSS